MKTTAFNFRMSDAELAALKKRAEQFHLSVSDYIRFQTLGPAACEKLPNAAALVKVSTELKRIGNNLNQSVKQIHEADKAGTLSTDQFASLHKAFAATLKMKTDIERMLQRALHLPKS